MYLRIQFLIIYLYLDKLNNNLSKKLAMYDVLPAFGKKVMYYSDLVRKRTKYLRIIFIK